MGGGNLNLTDDGKNRLKKINPQMPQAENAGSLVGNESLVTIYTQVLPDAREVLRTAMTEKTTSGKSNAHFAPAIQTLRQFAIGDISTIESNLSLDIHRTEMAEVQSSWKRTEKREMRSGPRSER